ncbi:MAG: right-handed parallel beta-helix repeat-containing protein [Candidatus Heimdallarchaeota archaeon]|nr:right-handed parallel beta-helix repeat-containing protein [Candidatus Heimdallarchaeota archaeon]
MRKTSKMGLSIGIFLLIFSLNMISNSQTTRSLQNNSNEQITIEDMIEIPDILITTDEDFGPLGYNFPGTGTTEDPYLIENYNVTSGGPFGILIDASGGGTGFNVSFIIRNCWVTAIEVCIKIVDASPDLVTIDNCTCVNTLGGDGIGIHLVNCDGATIINCKCLNNFHTGIRLDFSDSLWIENNVCSSNGDEGIFIDNASEFSLILNNTCLLNGQWGITNQFTNDNTFRYNNCSNNIVSGFGIYYSDRTILENNTASLNDVYGMHVLSSGYVDIIFNQMENNALYGVYKDSGSPYNRIHHNNFIGNNAGLGQQAYESGLLTSQNATWYDTGTNEGNYWDDYISPGPYSIDGTALNSDPYPLSSPVGIEFISEYASSILSIILLISFIGTICFVIRKK